MMYWGKKSSKATLCCGFRFFGAGGRRSSWLFYVRFPDVRNFKDSCGNLSGVFLLLTSRGSLKLYYPVLHSNQPYTIIQLFPPLNTQCVQGWFWRLQAATAEKDFRGLLLLSLPVPSIFHIRFLSGWVSDGLLIARSVESETRVFWDFGKFFWFSYSALIAGTVLKNNSVDWEIKNVNW